jgi:hypothetical protein
MQCTAPRVGRKGKQGKTKTYLFRSPIALSYILALPQPLKDSTDGGLFLLEFLHLQTLAASPGLLIQSIQSLLDKLDIFDPQLLADNIQIPHGINITFHVDDLGVVKASHNLEDGIDSPNVRQEGISQTSTRGGTASETGDIVHRQVGGYLGLGFVVLAQPIVPFVGNDHTSLFRVNCGVWKVGRVSQGAFCDGLEKGRFSHICQANLNFQTNAQREQTRISINLMHRKWTNAEKDKEFNKVREMVARKGCLSTGQRDVQCHF